MIKHHVNASYMCYCFIAFNTTHSSPSSLPFFPNLVFLSLYFPNFSFFTFLQRFVADPPTRHLLLFIVSPPFALHIISLPIEGFVVIFVFFYTSPTPTPHQHTHINSDYHQQQSLRKHNLHLKEF